MPSPAKLRAIVRSVHVAIAAIAALAIYVPQVPAETARLVLAAGALPLMALSGLFMAKQAALSRLVGRRTRATGAAR